MSDLTVGTNPYRIGTMKRKRPKTKKKKSPTRRKRTKR